ncbi:hypothetical protein G3A40_32645 [Paraburkholderia aspalathi]|uniref:hypothetical protein n=1 Tax=Paraburkholderia aspalathi TaxID=1324617 RepID=UPI00190E45CD|nr:hypothetical protein [Paraburkholderia aspalathi]MBK3864524.1 hypothetical protein [Paraburkholderia aspalathi]
METTTKSQLARLKKDAAKIPGKIAALEQALKATEARMVALKKAGIIYAREHWRVRGTSSGDAADEDTPAKGRYMILVYPMKHGERPNPTYIGCDPEKVKAAQEGIARAASYDEADRERQALERALRESEYAFSSLFRALDAY